MAKNRLFLLGACVVAAISGVAAAGPSHPCDDRVWYYTRSGATVRTSAVIVSPAPAAGAVVTVPPSSDVVIQRGWVTGAGESGPVRISTSGVTAITAPAPGYRPAWTDAPSSNVVVVPPASGSASTVVVVPDNAIVVQSPAVVQPLSAHDRLVVLNQFASPYSSDRTIVYRDATGLLHERTVFGGGGVFYDHLGRRCRYDHDRSTIVVLDDRVIRDYNRNGVCDDDRYRAAELRYYDSTLYRGVRPLGRPGNAWSPALRAEVHRPGVGCDDRDVRRYEPPRVEERRYVHPNRPAGGAVNGRLIDDSRRTGNDRKGSSSTSRPKR